jgi:hypothetical protein
LSAPSGSDPARLALFNQAVEVGEQRVGVVRAGRGFGVVLDGEDRQFPVAQSLDRAVVQVDLGDDRAALFKVRGSRGEAVILGGDGDLAGLDLSLKVLAPSAWVIMWLPMQMPNTGYFWMRPATVWWA